MKKTSIDLTEGPIITTVLRLAAPIMASSFLSAAYNIMDMAWVGMLGAQAVAGVGVSGMYMWLASGVATLPRMGGQVLSAQAIGRRDIDCARSYARGALQLAAVLGLLFALVSVTCTHQMVGFFNLNDEISEATAISYTRITCGLIFFMVINMSLTGLYTAQGDSRTPFRANFIGLAINMVLDPMMIMGIAFFPRLGANGAAIATVTAQVIVCAVLIHGMYSRGGVLFKEQKYLSMVPASYYREIARIGFPISIQSMAYCFISMLLSRMVAGFGPEAMAVLRVGNQIEALTWNTSDGYSNALNSFCGQNYGAKKADRIKRGYYFSAIAGFIWGGIVGLIFFLAPGALSSIFFHEESALLLAINYFMILAISEPFMSVEIISSGALSGIGMTRTCGIISITLTAARLPIAYILKSTAIGVAGIWWAFTVTSITKGIILFLAFNTLGVRRIDSNT